MFFATFFYPVHRSVMYRHAGIVFTLSSYLVPIGDYCVHPFRFSDRSTSLSRFDVA